MDWLGTLSHSFLIQGSKLCSFLEALSEVKSPCVPQLIQLLSRSSITLAHISLTEASCLPRMALTEWKCVVPLMCFGGELQVSGGQALMMTAVGPSSSQPVTSRFLPHGFLFSWEIVHVLGKVTSTNSSEAKCALSPLAGLSCDMEHMQMWYMPALGRSCRCCLCGLTWILSRWEVQAPYALMPEWEM